MSPRPLLRATLACCLLLFVAAQSHAQAGRPPGGGPPGGGGRAPAPPPPPPPPPPPGGNGAGPAGGPNGGNNGGNNNGGPAHSVTHAGVKLGPSGRWWDDKATAQTVGVRPTQQKKMDAILDANKPEIVRTYLAFQKQQTALDALTKSPQATDKTKLFAQIDAVNQARAALEKANTTMLLQIRGELDPTQLTKLDSLP